MITLKRAAINGLTALAMLGTSVVALAPAAQASGYYGNSAMYQDADWRWHRYPHPYYGYGYGYDPGAAVALGIIGMVAGTILSQANRYPHYYYGGGSCAERFRSYNPTTHQYMGYDGLPHPCP